VQTFQRQDLLLIAEVSEVLNDNCGHYTFTVPKDIAPGDYLIRAEVIALHVASSVGGAQ
jgi:cellulase